MGNKTTRKFVLKNQSTIQVSWSGTIMNAKLADSEKEQRKPGDVLYVLEVKGNILICSHKKP